MKKFIKFNLFNPNELSCRKFSVSKEFSRYFKNNFSQNLLNSEEKVTLISMSGGQDSIACFYFLLHIYSQNRVLDKNNLLEILYLHHLWQPKSFFMAELIFKLTYLFKKPYTIVIPTLTIITENQARNWRKTKLYRISSFLQIYSISQGQTLTDNLEESLQKIVRGTNPSVLSDLYKLEHLQSNYLFFPIKQNFLELKKQKNSLFFSNNKFYFLNISSHSDDVFVRVNSFLKSKEKNIFFGKRDFSKREQLINFSFWNFVQNNKLTKYSFRFRTTEFLKKGMIFSLNSSTLQKGSVVSSSFILSKEISLFYFSVENPLKKLTRTEVFYLIKNLNLPFIVDTTNYSNIFFRNKIRHELLPYINWISRQSVEKSFDQFQTLYQDQNKENQIKIIELYKIYMILFRYFPIQLTKYFLILNSTETKEILKMTFLDYKERELTFLQINELSKSI